VVTVYVVRVREVGGDAEQILAVTRSVGTAARLVHHAEEHGLAALEVALNMVGAPPANLEHYGRELSFSYEEHELI
jgi:hypothetical protein